MEMGILAAHGILNGYKPDLEDVARHQDVFADRYVPGVSAASAG